MNIDEFRDAHEHNAKILQRNLENRTTDISDIIFWEGCKGKELSFPTLMSKYNDVLGCCSVGGIPSIKKRGADGYIYFRGDTKNYFELESKVATIDPKYLHVGGRGGLYWTSNLENYNSKVTVLSYFSGSFIPTMSDKTRESKKRYTVLVCFDNDKNQVIDSWIMSPETILNEIKNRAGNASITIKLNRFIEQGVKMGSQIPVIGWDNWIKEQTENAKLANRFI